MKKRRKKYKRGYPNNPKVEIMDKRIPFSTTMQRRTVLLINSLAEELQVKRSVLVEEIVLDFIKQLKNKN